MSSNGEPQVSHSAKGILRLLAGHLVHLQKNYLLHYYVGDKLQFVERNYLGIPMITLSTAAAASSAAVLAFQPSAFPGWLKLTAFFCSGAASILAALMTFLGYKDKAFLHHHAAANYRHLFNRCNAFVSDPELHSLPADELRKREAEITAAIHELHKDSPLIPGSAYSKIGKLIAEHAALEQQVMNTLEPRRAPRATELTQKDR